MKSLCIFIRLLNCGNYDPLPSMLIYHGVNKQDITYLFLYLFQKSKNTTSVFFALDTAPDITNILERFLIGVDSEMLKSLSLDQ